MTDLNDLLQQAAQTALSRKQMADSLFEQAGKIGAVNTDEDADLVGRLARRVKALLADIDEERKSYTRVLDNTKTSIMAEYKPAVTLLTDSESHLKGVLDEARRKEQARLDAEREARERALESAIADGRHADADAIIEEQLTPQPERAYMPPGTGTGGRWRAEVTDLQAFIRWATELGVVGEYFLPDMKMLTAMASARKAESRIPGVVFKKDEWVTVGRA